MPLRPQLLHRLNRRIGDSGERPAPPGVRRSDHAGVGVGEQHRRAIGGEDAQRQPRNIGRHRIGLRSLADLPRLRDGDRLAAVDLIKRQQLRFRLLAQFSKSLAEVSQRRRHV